MSEPPAARPPMPSTWGRPAGSGWFGWGAYTGVTRYLRHVSQVVGDAMARIRPSVIGSRIPALPPEPWELPDSVTPGPAGWFSLAVHVGPAGFRLRNRPISPADLALAIWHCPRWRGRPVLLVTQTTAPADGAGPMLRQLAIEMGTPVYAADAGVQFTFGRASTDGQFWCWRPGSNDQPQATGQVLPPPSSVRGRRGAVRFPSEAAESAVRDRRTAIRTVAAPGSSKAGPSSVPGGGPPLSRNLALRSTVAGPAPTTGLTFTARVAGAARVLRTSGSALAVSLTSASAGVLTAAALSGDEHSGGRSGNAASQAMAVGLIPIVGAAVAARPTTFSGTVSGSAAGSVTAVRDGVGSRSASTAGFAMPAWPSTADTRRAAGPCATESGPVEGPHARSTAESFRGAVPTRAPAADRRRAPGPVDASCATEAAESFSGAVPPQAPASDTRAVNGMRSVDGSAVLSSAGRHRAAGAAPAREADTAWGPSPEVDAAWMPPAAEAAWVPPPVEDAVWVPPPADTAWVPPAPTETAWVPPSATDTAWVAPAMAETTPPEMSAVATTTAAPAAAAPRAAAPRAAAPRAATSEAGTAATEALTAAIPAAAIPVETSSGATDLAPANVAASALTAPDLAATTPAATDPAGAAVTASAVVEAPAATFEPETAWPAVLPMTVPMMSAPRVDLGIRSIDIPGLSMAGVDMSGVDLDTHRPQGTAPGREREAGAATAVVTGTAEVDEPPGRMAKTTAPAWFPVRPRTEDDDRDRMRTALGWKFQTHSRTVARTMSMHPGLRTAIGAHDVITGLVAVLALLEPDGGRINTALRDGATPDEDIQLLARCAAAGLMQLPAVSGPVFGTAPDGIDLADRYRPGELLVEPGFTEVSLAPGSGTTPRYAIWSATARRFDQLRTPQELAARGGRAMFAAGTRFAVLDVDEDGSEAGRHVLLREIVFDRRDSGLDERMTRKLRAALAVPPSQAAEPAALAWPLGLDGAHRRFSSDPTGADGDGHDRREKP